MSFGQLYTNTGDLKCSSVKYFSCSLAKSSPCFGSYSNFLPELIKISIASLCVTLAGLLFITIFNLSISPGSTNLFKN